MNIYKLSFVRFIKKIKGTILLIMITMCTISCNKDSENISVREGVINSITPTIGPGDTEVVINTTGLSNDSDNLTVLFNNKDAEIISFNGTEIKVVVPRGALTGNVAIRFEGKEIKGPTFTYEITPVKVITLTGSETIGNVDGDVKDARFIVPTGITVNDSGTLFISEYGGRKVREIENEKNVVSIIGKDINFEDDFTGISLTSSESDGILFCSNVINNRVEKIDLLTKELITIPNIDVRTPFSKPSGICINKINKDIYVSDFGNHVIRKISSENVISIYAGTGMAGNQDGSLDNAQFTNPQGLAIDSIGNIYVADSGNSIIRKISTDGTITTFAGTGERGFSDGTTASAKFNNPVDIAIANDGTIYLTDSANHRIRKISTDRVVSTYAGTGQVGFKDGIASEALFNNPRGITIDDNNVLYVTMNHGIRKITPSF